MTARVRWWAFMVAMALVGGILYGAAMVLVSALATPSTGYIGVRDCAVSTLPDCDGEPRPGRSHR